MTSRTEQALPASIALAWALTGVLHLLTFKWTLPTSWAGILYTGAILFLLSGPGHFPRQFTFFAASALVLGMNYPRASNHLVLEFWILISILGTLLVRSLTTEPRNSDRRPSLLETVAPLVRAQYLTAFLFAAFSKLNRDFLDPEWSCAAVFAQQTAEFLKLEALSFGLLSPDQSSLAFLAIYLTLACEFAIPSLLLFRRTRTPGIYLALAFHFAIGFIPILGISSFSALSFVLLLFFFPARSLSLIEQRLHRLSWAIRQNKSTRILTFPVTASLLAFALYLQYRFYHPAAAPVAIAVWLSVCVPFLSFAIKALRETRAIGELAEVAGSGYYFLPKPAFLAALSLPIIILGTLPYLGLQTQGSFTMFSNLRTLGDHPNHLIAKPYSQGRTPILIKILSTNHPRLLTYPDSELLITSHEFRRKTAHTEKDFFALCEFENQIELLGRFEGQLTPHPFLSPLPPVPFSWIRYRDVPAGEHCECTW